MNNKKILWLIPSVIVPAFFLLLAYFLSEGFSFIPLLGEMKDYRNIRFIFIAFIIGDYAVSRMVFNPRKIECNDMRITVLKLSLALSPSVIGYVDFILTGEWYFFLACLGVSFIGGLDLRKFV